MPVDVVGLARVAGMLKARRQPHQGRATLIKPVPERAPAGRTAQHLRDGNLRLGVGGEPVRVAPVVVGDGRGVDVDAGGDMCVQRPRQWVRQCPGGTTCLPKSAARKAAV